MKLVAVETCDDDGDDLGNDEVDKEVEKMLEKETRPIVISQWLGGRRGAFMVNGSLYCDS